MAPRHLSAILVEDAGVDDLPAIIIIANEVIANTTAIFSDDPETVDERAAWWRARVDAGFPVLVARDGGVAVGFASYGVFRVRSGYRTTVEHSVHVRADWRGCGVGTALIAALLARAVAAGVHAMVAGIDGDNVGSIRLHERLGFAEVGRMPQVARKFDRWLTLVLLQRLL